MNKNLSWFMGVICGVVLAFGLSLGGVAVSAEQAPPSSMEQQITSAKSKADHEALAAQYEQDAKDAKAKADEHRDMAKAYARAGFGEKHNLQAHCKTIAERYEQVAKESIAMAKIHRELAEKAK
jgi:hypothetical protein